MLLIFPEGGNPNFFLVSQRLIEKKIAAIDILCKDNVTFQWTIKNVRNVLNFIISF